MGLIEVEARKLKGGGHSTAASPRLGWRLRETSGKHIRPPALIMGMRRSPGCRGIESVMKMDEDHICRDDELMSGPGP